MTTFHDVTPIVKAGEPTTAEQIAALVRRFDAVRMKAWLVSKAVGNIRNKGADLPEPIAVWKADKWTNT